MGDCFPTSISSLFTKVVTSFRKRAGKRARTHTRRRPPSPVGPGLNTHTHTHTYTHSEVKKQAMKILQPDVNTWEAVTKEFG